MTKLITGIHHITALASSAQKNFDFYAGVMGLRLVKKTINFDAPEVYHLYYGDTNGNPGTILTFFPYEGIPSGRKGKGQLTTTSFSIGEKALDFWMKRLDQFKIGYESPTERFKDEVVIYLEDNDGLGLELVANKNDYRKGFEKGPVPAEYAIKGFYGVVLTEEGYERTAGLLRTQMDHEPIQEQGNRFRYSASGKPGDFVDLLCAPDALKGLPGAGTIHHIAFATPDDATQLQAREKLAKAGLNVTPVLDREYFHSIYFREPGGVLFEVATNPPGFAVDEPVDELGTHLKLPPWYEKNRKIIEEALPPLNTSLERFQHG